MFLSNIEVIIGASWVCVNVFVPLLQGLICSGAVQYSFRHLFWSQSAILTVWVDTGSTLHIYEVQTNQITQLLHARGLMAKMHLNLFLPWSLQYSPHTLVGSGGISLSISHLP